MRMESHLKEVLELRGLTIEYAADKTGLDAKALEKICNNDFRALRKSTLVVICEVAQCQVSDFIKVVPD